jgi:hypothetical protein
MEDSEIFAKAMPIAHVVHHVGIEVGQIAIIGRVLLKSKPKTQTEFIHDTGDRWLGSRIW